MSILCILIVVKLSMGGGDIYQSNSTDVSEKAFNDPEDSDFDESSGKVCVECRLVYSGARFPDDCNACDDSATEDKQAVTNGLMSGCCLGERPAEDNHGWILMGSLFTG